MNLPDQRPPRAVNERPSRPLSAYNYFFQCERNRLLQENPQVVKHLGFKGMARFIGQAWKKLDATGKSPYKQMAVADKKRHALELLAWYEEQEQFMVRLQKEEEQEGKTTATTTCTTSDVVSATVLAEDQAIVKKENIPNDSASTSSMFSSTSAEKTSCPSFDHQDPCSIKSSTTVPVAVKKFDRADIPFSFQEHHSLASMARDFGNDGIEYLLRVLH